MREKDFLGSEGRPHNNYLEARVSFHISVERLVAEGILRASACVWNELPRKSESDERNKG